jgi:maltose-binding protein MalE
MVSDDLTQSTINLPIKNASNTDVYAGKNAVDFYNSYSDPNSPTYTWNSSMPNDIEAFTKNQVAMIFGYSNTSSYLKQVYPNFQFEQALVPQIGDTNDIIDYTHYTSYVVPEASPMAETAWEFIKLLSVDDASTYVSVTDEVSSKKIEAEIVLKNRGTNTPSQDQIKTSKSWNKGRYPVNVDLQLKSAIDRVNSGSQNSQATLDTASSNITELLRKTTW